jgi:hypothetical protein
MVITGSDPQVLPLTPLCCVCHLKQMITWNFLFDCCGVICVPLYQKFQQGDESAVVLLRV